MFCGMFFLGILSSVLCFLSTATTNNITIGGIFDLYDEDGNVDQGQIQCLSAFLMAVDEINNKTDGIFDDLLPSVYLNAVVRNAGRSRRGAANAADSLLNSTVGSNDPVKSVVSTLDDESTGLTNAIFSDARVLQAFTHATHPSFGFTKTSPYHISLAPLESFQGTVLQDVICKVFDYHRVVIFAEMSEYGQMATHAVTDQTFCDTTKLSVIDFPIGVGDFTPYIDLAKEHLGTVYLVFCGVIDAAHLLEQGYYQGLFERHTQLFGGHELFNSTLWTEMKADSDVAHILDGLVLVEYFPEFAFGTPEGQVFMDRWRALPSTVGGGVGSCVNDVDDSADSFPLFRVEGSGECMGLDYSSFPQDGSTMDYHALNVYDAVIALARGYNVTIEAGTYNNIATDVNVLENAIIHDVEFEGSSGHVEFSEGISLYKGFGRGNRVQGYHYKLYNFHKEVYATTPADSLVYVGNWSREHGTYLCGEDASIADCGTLIPVLLGDGSWVDDVPPFSNVDFPDVLKVGLLIEPLVDPETKEMNVAAVEELAAVMMAIDQINNKTDGVHDDVLPNTRIVLAVENAETEYQATLMAHDLVEKAFGGSSVQAGIISYVGPMAISAASALSSAGTLQVTTHAHTSTLADTDFYPTLTMMVPSDSYSANVMEHMACNFFEYQKVVVITMASVFGVQARRTLEAAEYCSLDIMATISVGEKKTKHTALLESIKGVGGRVFMLFLTPVIAANILEEGYEMGLFARNTQILLTTTSLEGETAIFEHFSPASDVATLMRGVIMVEYWPDYFVNLSANTDFLRNWSLQEASINVDANGNETCSTAYDDADNHFLFHEPLVSGMDSRDAKCAGLNFSEYDFNFPNRSHVQPYSLISYDALHMLALGADILIKAGINFTATALEDALVYNVTSSGASGPLDIDHGDSHNDNFGRGMRTGGAVYKVLNFNSDVYNADANHSHGFSRVGAWRRSTGGIMLCDQATESDCRAAVYNTASGVSFPADSPPPIMVEISATGNGIAMFLGIITVLLALYCGWFINMYKKNKIIRASQPEMLHWISLGGLLSGVRTIVGAVEVTDTTCSTNIWLGHLAFFFIVCTMLLKSWRVDRIVNNKSLVRIKITLQDVLTRLVAVIVFAIAYLVVLQVVGEPHSGYVQEEVSNQVTMWPTCRLTHPEFELALFCVEGVVLAVGIHLSYATKDVPAALNESRSIAEAITVVALFSALIFPVVFLFEMEVTVSQLIASLSIIIATIFVMTIIFYPKFRAIWDGAEVDENLKIVKQDDQNLAAHNADVEDRSKSKSNSKKSGTKSGSKSGAFDGSDLLMADAVGKKKMSHNEKFVLVQEQIEMWKNMLVKLELEDGRHSGSGSGGSGGSSGKNPSVHSSHAVYPSMGPDDVVEKYATHDNAFRATTLQLQSTESKGGDHKQSAIEMV